MKLRPEEVAAVDRAAERFAVNGRGDRVAVDGRGVRVHVVDVRTFGDTVQQRRTQVPDAVPCAVL